MKKSGNFLMLLVAVVLLLVGSVTTAYAHGVIISYNLTSNGQVELYAEFDTGEAMTEAQVTIYAPNDPLNPWLVGTSDAEGRFVFTLDPELMGTWDIQYRKAGHGDMVHFELESGMIDPALVDSSAVGQPVLTAMAVPAASAAETAPVVEPAEAEAAAPIEAEDSEPAETAVAVEAAEPQANIETNAENSATTEESAAAVTIAQTEPAAAAQPETSAAPVSVMSGGNTGNGGGFTSLQILLMSASVIWGFVGTALYFSNKGATAHDHSHEAAHGHPH